MFLIVFGSLYPFSFSLAGARPARAPRRAAACRHDAQRRRRQRAPVPAARHLPRLASRRAPRSHARGARRNADRGAASRSRSSSRSSTRRGGSRASPTSPATRRALSLGGGLALAIARTRRSLHVSHFAGFLRHPVAAALFFSWIGYRLSPFALVFDPAEWAASVAPFAAGGWPSRRRRAGAPASPGSRSCSSATRLAPGTRDGARGRRDGRRARGTHPVRGHGARARGARRHGRRARSRAARSPASPPAGAPRCSPSALLALIAWHGLSPFDFQVAPDRFALLPFGESLTQYRAANLADMFLRCFTNGALVWLLVQAGRRHLAATGIGAGRGVRDRAAADLAAGTDGGDHRPAARRVRRRADRGLRAGGRPVSGTGRTREHDPAGMVYLPSMIPVLAALLLAAAPAEGQVGEAPAPVPRGDGTACRRPTALRRHGRARRAPPAARILPPGLADGGLPAVPQRCMSSRASTRPCPTPSSVVELSEARRGARLRTADRLQQPRRHPVPARRLRRAAEAATASRSSCSKATQGISSRRLVVPLAGLGAVYAAQDQHQVAAELFDRALAVSRRADGLFNLQQLPLIDQAADSRYAINDFGGAEREHLYALKIAEQNYGYGDTRTLPPLLELGDLLREPARVHRGPEHVHARARRRRSKPGVTTPRRSGALTGIARSPPAPVHDGPGPARQPAAGTRRDHRRDRRQGLQGIARAAARRRPHRPQGGADALELLRSTSEPPAELLTRDADRARRLVPDDVAAEPCRSPTTPRPPRSSTRQTAADPLVGHPLNAPRMVFYRPPLVVEPQAQHAVGAVRHPQDRLQLPGVGDRPAAGHHRRLDGHGTRASSRSRSARSRRRSTARASSDGQAVSTAGVTFTSEWYQE